MPAPDVQVDDEGVLTIGWGEPDWLGPARFEVASAAGPPRVERNGDVVAIERGAVRAEVVTDAGDGLALLRLHAIDDLTDLAAGDFAQPVVAWRFEPARRAAGGAPDGLAGFAYQYTEFAYPVFADADLAIWRLLPFRPAVVLPLGLSASDGRTLLLAPLDAFHEQVVAVPADRAALDAGLRVGWHGDLDHVPAGFTTELAVIAGEGPRACLARWGALLRERSGAPAPRRDSDALGTRLSYWTDNGSAYWYRTEPGHDVASGIVATVDDLEARGLPIGAVQLDSWWYPHEVLRPFNTDEWVVPPTGMVTWEPRADVLPDGIGALRTRLARRPFVTHCRHLSSASPYVDEFECWVDDDRAHPQTAELYERLLDQAVAWGVETFEHDWLVECFLGVRGLREAPGRATAWQDGIDAALGARNLTAQWCMATPADFAQTTRLRNITSIRTSGDHGYLVGPEVLWAWFLQTNAFARALGLWPYKDVFLSAPEHDEREVEALLATLSAGPVGVGDPLGAADPDLVRRCCRADGVLVRPDVPLAATDASVRTSAYLEPVVATAHTTHTSGRWAYVLALQTGKDERAEAVVSLAGLGEDRPRAADGHGGSDDVVAFNWRTRECAVVANGEYRVTLDRLDWDLRVLAPVLAGGITVFGDPRCYATIGDTRVADVRVVPAAGMDEGAHAVEVTVLGAGEDVPIAGWSRGAVTARTWSPSDGWHDLPVALDERTGAWEVDVHIGPAGWVRVQLRPVGR